MPSLTSDATQMIEARDVRKAFGHVQVLRGVSLSVYRGEVVAVIGPSGSGKSTFLRCLNHLETIDSGHIAIEGETLATTDAQGRCAYVSDAEVRRIGAKTGMVFQHFNLFPHLTVLENLIEAPMVVQGLARDAAIARAEALLDKVGLAQKRDNYPSRLSGGQKQRVAIARALLKNPLILVLDEATSALDTRTEKAIQAELLEIARSRTSLIIAHRLSTVVEADEILVFEAGRIVERGRHADLLARDGAYAHMWALQQQQHEAEEG